MSFTDPVPVFTKEHKLEWCKSTVPSFVLSEDRQSYRFELDGHEYEMRCPDAGFEEALLDLAIEVIERLTGKLTPATQRHRDVQAEIARLDEA